MMKKTVALIAVALIVAVLTVFISGCVGTTPPNSSQTSVAGQDNNTSIVGEWRSVKTYEVSSGTVHLVYDFKDDNTGTAGNEARGKLTRTIPIFWGYDAESDRYIVGYPASQNVDLFTMSEDGKYIINSDGDKFKKI